MGDPKLEKLLASVKGFASSIMLNEDPHLLSLLGSSGAGKTHLAARLLAFWRQHAGWRQTQGKAGTVQSLRSSAFKSWVKFINRQRGGQFDEITDIAETDFVILDDIGAEHDPRGFAKAKLYELISCRLGKWTVITSNLLIDQISSTIDVRIASRLLRGGSQVIQIEVPDFNLRKIQNP